MDGWLQLGAQSGKMVGGRRFAELGKAGGGGGGGIVEWRNGGMNGEVRAPVAIIRSAVAARPIGWREGGWGD